MSASRLLVLTSVLIGLVLCSASSIQSQDAAFKMNVISQVNGLRVQTDLPGGVVASFGGIGVFQVDAPFVPGGRFAVTEAGRVGIGTVNPSSRLHVRVPGSASPVSAMTVDVDSFSTSGNAQGSFFFRARDIGANAPSAFMIRGDGNVGIGTDGPAEKLTVAGMVQSTSGGFKFPDGSVQTTGGATIFTTTCVEYPVLASLPKSICHLNLPNGTYLLGLTSVLYNLAADFFSNNNRRAECGFTGDLLYDHDIGSLATATLDLHSVLTVTSGGIDVNCSTDQAGIVVYDRRLTATLISGGAVVQ